MASRRGSCEVSVGVMRDCLTGRDRRCKPKGRPADGVGRVQRRWIKVLSKRLAMPWVQGRVGGWIMGLAGDWVLWFGVWFGVLVRWFLCMVRVPGSGFCRAAALVSSAIRAFGGCLGTRRR